MRKFVRQILLFSLVAFVGFSLWIFLLGGTGFLRTVNYRQGNYGHLFSRAAEAADYGPVDILFLGSSHAYRTFDTRYFDSLGYRTFNLGSSNQTPIQTLVLLQQYLDRLSPKLVVFEVHPDIMVNDGVEGAVDLLSNVPISRQSVSMALDYENLKVMNTLYYSAFRQYVCRSFDGFVEDSVVEGWKYESGGFVHILHEPSLSHETFSDRWIDIDRDQLEALRQCIRLIESQGIRCLLVEVPASTPLRESYLNHCEFEDMMSGMGVRYHYFSPMPEPDSLYYSDADHLNLRGARLLCRRMADLIESKHLLP